MYLSNLMWSAPMYTFSQYDASATSAAAWVSSLGDALVLLLLLADAADAADADHLMRQAHRRSFLNGKRFDIAWECSPAFVLRTRVALGQIVIVHVLSLLLRQRRIVVSRRILQNNPRCG